MILQNVVLPTQKDEKTQKLYYRVSGGRGKVSIGGTMVFAGRRRVVFDTYMNCFSVAKWYRYAGLREISLEVALRGTFLLKLIHIYRKRDGTIVRDEQAAVRAESGEKKTFSLACSFAQAPRCGILAFSAENLGEEGELYAAAYTSAQPPRRPVKIGIGICTYRREEYIKANVERLKKAFLENESSPLFENLQVFISDNAGTLAAKDVCARGVHLFRNKNTGGSGGFTRTMIEVNAANDAGAGFTHILLMDDDVSFETESIYRTYSMLRMLREEYRNRFVGGAMFRIERPWLQYASGERWRKADGLWEYETFNLDRDMRKLFHVLDNEQPVPGNYQGWWYCAVPMTVCRKDNLSLPLFIKVDDIEYSMRNKAEIILLNGVNVWHESFETKYSSANEYYSVRNYLIAATLLRGGIRGEDAAKYVRRNFVRYLYNYKYDEAELTLLAVKDFLRGPEFLRETDFEKKNKEIMAKNRKMIPAEEFPVKFDKQLYERCMAAPVRRARLKKLFALVTLNGLLLPSRKIVSFSPWGAWSYTQTFRAEYFVAYEPTTKKGFVLRRSLRRFLRCIFMFFRTARLFRKQYGRVSALWKEQYRELIDEESWLKIL